MNYYQTIAQLEKIQPDPTSKRLVFCEETGLDYYFAPSAPTFNENGFSILDTGLLGDTRWIAIDTFMKFSHIGISDNLVIKHGMKLQQGRARCTFLNGKVLQKIVIFDLQFSTIPVMTTTKRDFSNVTMNQRRHGTIICTPTISSVTINYESQLNNFSTNATADVHWQAMGEY